MERMLVNGVDGATGYLRGARNNVLADLGHLRSLLPAPTASRLPERGFGPSLAPRHGVDSRRLDQAGWGLILAPGLSPAIREALEPLVRIRRDQAGDRFCDFTRPERKPWRTGDSASRFLRRNGQAPGDVDPDAVPYYLLVVGAPSEVSFEDQFRLGVQHAVGRLDLDSIDAYDAYARRVVDAEQEGAQQTANAAFFGPCHANDPATLASSTYLIAELADRLAQTLCWQIDAYIGPAASKQELIRLLTSTDAARLVFAACHGIAYPAGDPRQRERQGGLLCQDWHGRQDTPIAESHALWASDLEVGATLAPSIVLLFSCNGAGTSRVDVFAEAQGRPELVQAPASFVSALPKRLLGHPRGGALAVVAHVDEAWGHSFLCDGVGPQTYAFEDVIAQLLDGERVGAALEPFRERYKEYGIELSERLVGGWSSIRDHGRDVTAYLDARQYVLLGDPAVALDAA